jgi:FkbM family methyltransferase
MNLDMLRWRFRAWRYRLKLERMEIRLLREHLSAGDTVIDIGGHKGAITWWMRQAVGRTGQVDVFEPQPALAGRLKALVEASGFDNVHVEHGGVSSQPGTLTLRVPPGGPSPSASFEHLDLAEGGETFTVPVTTVDAWMASRGHGPLRLAKVDVEGHELEVFRGAIRTLENDRPFLLFECELRHRSSGTLRDVFDFLEGLGYEGFAVSEEGLMPVSEFDPDRHQRSDSDAPYLNNFWFRPR